MLLSFKYRFEYVKDCEDDDSDLPYDAVYSDVFEYDYHSDKNTISFSEAEKVLKKEIKLPNDADNIIVIEITMKKVETLRELDKEMKYYLSSSIK